MPPDLPLLLELVESALLGGAVGVLLAVQAWLRLAVRALLALRAAEPLLTLAVSATETRSTTGESTLPTLDPGARPGTRMIPADDEPGAEADREDQHSTGCGRHRGGTQPTQEVVAR